MLGGWFPVHLGETTTDHKVDCTSQFNNSVNGEVVVINLMLGDCLERMKEIPDNSVDSIVTDPPYGIRFMSQKWDYEVPSVDIWRECFRVLKHGGHLLSFAGTRTQHRMAVNIEDAGFEIRDMLAWVYGSGFPKNMNIGKAIDKKSDSLGLNEHSWHGWGTALKPALEPITLARKPISEKTILANVLAHSVGGLNIDECRVGDYKNTTPSGVDRRNAKLAELGYRPNPYQIGEKKPDSAAGRHPANFIHDGSDDVLSAFPVSKSPWIGNSNKGKKGGKMFGGGKQSISEKPEYRDEGSVSRFFYCAKTSKKDRGEGNNHTTVKPTELMRYLCRLVTPQKGTVLDPFMGSGSTGKAAIAEGFSFTGIEQEKDSMDTSEKRIKQAIIDSGIKKDVVIS